LDFSELSILESKMKKSEAKILAGIEDGYSNMPEDASIDDILEMIAGVTNEPVKTVKKRYKKILKNR
jgi:hypothetical protein